MVFFDWGHNQYEFNQQPISQMHDLFTTEKPDLVVAHRPIDTHPDHQIMGALAQHLFICQRQWRLSFFEVFAGIQTLEFEPNRYLDISDEVEQKNQSIRCHVSPKPESQVEMHEQMSRSRGLEFGVKHAEAFRVMGRSAPSSTDVFFSPARQYGRDK